MIEEMLQFPQCFVAVYCKKFTQTDRHCVSGWAVVLCVSKECSGFT
jgi:hypothetical protein